MWRWLLSPHVVHHHSSNNPNSPHQKMRCHPELSEGSQRQVLATSPRVFFHLKRLWLSNRSAGQATVRAVPVAQNNSTTLRTYANFALLILFSADHMKLHDVRRSPYSQWRSRHDPDHVALLYQSFFQQSLLRQRR